MPKWSTVSRIQTRGVGSHYSRRDFELRAADARREPARPVERKKRPEIESHFGEDAVEPVVVKNLETVQGDERDVILIGIGYGPTKPGAGTMSMTSVL